MTDEIRYNCPYGEEKLKRVQGILLEMLVEIDALFVKHNIRYFLIYGTLLGTVRHKGYIPWDDDLDICVMKDDYDQAMDILRKNLPDRYIVHDKLTDPIYWCEFSKIRYRKSDTTCELWPEDNKFTYRGVCLDIYRCWEEDRSLYEYRYEKNLEVLVYHARNLGGSGGAKQWARSLVGLGYRVLLQGYYWLRKTVETKEDCYWFDPDFHCTPATKEELFPFKQMEFNGRCYPVPNDPDCMLRKKYGNYMDLPALEHRKPHYSSVEFED
ncbi:LicD family protein [Macellibacteroides fermentans]|uniref:LicD family protein n=1 Tax=Macellibacteroides fermentans TaxID=879969 RepID=UPI00406C9257